MKRDGIYSNFKNNIMTAKGGIEEKGKKMLRNILLGLLPVFISTISLAQPTFTNAHFFDTNGDGTIDEVTIEMSGTISDATVVNTDFSIGGSAPGSVLATSVNSLDQDDTDDKFFTFPVNIAGTEVAAVAYTQGILSNGSLVDTNLTITTVDAAAPVITDLQIEDTDSDGHIDKVVVTWSENIDTDDGSAPVVADMGTILLPDGSTAGGFGNGNITDPAGTSNTITVSNITGQGTVNTAAGSSDIDGLTGLWEDAANNAVTATGDNTETITDAAAPIFLNLTINNAANTNVTLNFSEPVGRNSDATGAIREPEEYVISVSSTPAVLNTIGTSHVQTTSVDNLTISYTTQANGTENLIATIAGANQIYDVGGNAIADGSSVNASLNDATGPSIIGYTLAADNSYIDIEFNEGVYAADGVSPLANQADGTDFTITYTDNGGNATGVTITSANLVSGGPLIGGETTVRLNITVAGAPASGDEEIEIKAAATSIYDQLQNASPTSETTNKLNLFDKMAPSGYTISIQNLTNGYINKAEETDFTFKFAGAEVGATYSYSIDDVIGNGPITGTDLGPIGSATETVSGIDISALADENITVTVSLKDANGNTGGDVTDTDPKDATLPTFISIVLNTTDNTDVTLTFSEAVYENNDQTGNLREPNEYGFTISGGSAAISNITDSHTAGTTSASLTISYSTPADGSDFLVVTEGDNIFDKARNKMANNATINKALNDQTQPVVTIDALETNDQTPPLSGTVVDIDLTTSISVNVNGFDYPAVNSGLGTWTLADNTIASLPEAIYEVIVTATDGNSNVGLDGSNNELTIDISDPVVTVDALETLDTTPELTGTVVDADLTASISVMVGAAGPFVATNVGDGTWILPDNTITPALTEGFFEIAVTATDGAGNQGSDGSTNELEVDTSPPTILSAVSSPHESNTEKAYVLLTFNEGVYSSSSGGGLTADGDDYYTVTDNNIPSGINWHFDNIKEVWNGSAWVDAVGGETQIRVLVHANKNYTSGSEVTINTQTNTVFDLSGNGSPNTTTTGTVTFQDNAGPTISTAIVDNNNTYIDIEFDESVYSTTGSTGGLSTASFTIDFTPDNATIFTVTSIFTTDDNGVTYDIPTPTGAGGETKFRINFTTDLPASGAEQIIVKPATTASWYDNGDNVTDTDPLLIIGPVVTLNDKLPPTLSSITLATTNPFVTKARVGDDVSVTFTASETLQSDPVVTFSSDGNGVTGSVTINNASAPVYTATYTVGTDVQDMDGAVTFTINFTDTNANPGVTVTTPDAGTVTIDNNKPDIFDVTFNTDPIYEGALIQTVSVIFDEDMDPNVTLYPVINLTGSNWLTQADIGWLPDKRTFQATFTHNPTEEEITVTVTVDAGDSKDDAGNTNNASAGLFTFEVDTQKPQATVSIDDPDGFVLDGQSVVITSIFDEVLTTAPEIVVTATVNGGTFTMVGTAPTATWTHTYIAGATEETVTYTFQTGTDAAGNEIDAAPLGTVSFEIDNTDPFMTLLNPLHDTHNIPLGSVYTITLNEIVVGSGSSDIFLKKFDGTTIGTFNSTDVFGTNTSSEDMTGTIDLTTVVLTEPILESTEYHLLINPGAVIDMA